MIQQTILFNGFMIVSVADRREKYSVTFRKEPTNGLALENRLADSSADLPRDSSHFVDGCFRDLAQFEYPTWGEVV